MKKSKKCSLYRTEHCFEEYHTIDSEEKALGTLQRLSSADSPLYILGNGSNTLFTKKKVKSVILKNALPRKIEQVGAGEFYISSSMLVSEVLKYCFSQGRDCFYYLASVPAEIGGALAMNAGQGLAKGGESIMDFVKEVRYIQNGKIIIEPPSALSVSYRKTIFTDQERLFILGATFKFPNGKIFKSNPIKERISWAKEKQDLGKPNCGSVFKIVDMRILNRFRGLSICGATFSKKTNNWIINSSKSPFGINCLIRIVILFHKIFFRKCEVEVIRVK